MSDRSMGRGDIAVADMKARIEFMRDRGLTGAEIISVLFDRAVQAEQGAGYEYDFAGAEPVRSDGQLRQPAGG